MIILTQHSLKFTSKFNREGEDERPGKKAVARGILFLGVAILIFILAGCSQQENTATPEQQDEPLEPVVVDLQVPEHGKVGESITVLATVTQGDEPVEDADEVVFEIWEDGNKDNSEMIDYEHHENGTYKIETTFAKEGTYMIQVHVTARRMHVMPTKQITIGDGGQQNVEDDNEND